MSRAAGGRRKEAARVFNTGRVREACHFHPSAHGACCSTRTVLFVWLARVSEGFSTGRVRDFGNTGRADWHGSTLELHGSCNFPSSEVGNLIFSQYSGFIMI